MPTERRSVGTGVQRATDHELHTAQNVTFLPICKYELYKRLFIVRSLFKFNFNYQSNSFYCNTIMMVCLFVYIIMFFSTLVLIVSNFIVACAFVTCY